MGRMRYATAVPIGRGATGEVVRAWDPELEREVALKILRRDDPGLARRMQREARLQARVEHPNVCRVYEVGETDEGRPYIAMEYVAGRPLDEAAAGMTREQRVEVVRRVAEAVHAAHGVGLVHRDLKPANVLVTETGGRLEPKVVDFGIARDESAERLTMTGQLLGTPDYISPEQARGELGAVDRRSDVFSLGAMLYELLGGRTPFGGGSTAETLSRVLACDPPPLRAVAAGVPADLEAVAMRCLEADPERRYPTAAALAEDLGRYLRGEPVTARRRGAAARIVRTVRRHPVAAVLAAVLLVGGTAGSIKYALDLQRSRQQALAARDDAERLVEFMLEDLYRQLEPVGRLDVLADASAEIAAYYERFPPGELDRDQRLRRGIVHLNLGYVLASEGRLEASMEASRTAIGLLSELVGSQGPSAAAVAALAEAHSSLAQSLVETGELDAARDHVGTSLELRRGLAAAQGSPEARIAVADSLGDLGWVEVERGEAGRALGLLEESHGILAELAASRPDNLRWQYRLAESDSYLGRALMDAGRPEEALERYRDALGRVEALVAAEPANTEWRFEQLLLAGRRGWALEELGRPEAALGVYRDGLEVGAALTAHDPDNARWLREVSVLHSAIAEILREQGRPGRALPHARESLAITSRLAGRGDAHASEANDLAWDLVQVGAILEAVGEPERAAEHWRRAVEVIAPVTREVDSPWYLDTHAAALLHLGRAEEARPLVERLLEQGWDDPDLLALAAGHGLVPEARSGDG